MAKSKNGVCYIEFRYKQIGMDESYFKRMCMVLEENKIKIKREVLLQRTRGADDSPFLEDDLQYINSRAKSAARELIIKDIYILKVYDELHPEYPYIVSVDPATGLGVGSDNTAINIIDPYTLTSIAVLVTPYADAVETSEIIVEIITRITPKAMLVIERNSLGSGVIAIIARTPVASNLYYDSTKTLEINTDEKLNKKGYLDASPAMRRYWGVTTINKNREIMTNEILTNYVHNFKNRFIAPELIDDLNNLCVKTGGRIEARKGAHDDVVMSYLIGVYVYEYGKNIHQWGIVKGMRPMSKSEDSVNKNYTYADYYEELPDDLKSFFPNPNGDSYSFMGSMGNNMAPTGPGFAVENGFRVDGSERNEIYDKINEIQAKNAGKVREVIQPDGTVVKVRGNVAVSDMVKEAAEGNNTDLLDVVIT